MKKEFVDCCVVVSIFLCGAIAQLVMSADISFFFKFIVWMLFSLLAFKIFYLGVKYG